MMSRSFAVLLVVLSGASWSTGQDPVFSGPQAGEKLGSFKVQGVFDDAAGKEIDFVAAAAGKPIVLIFVHEVNRPTMGLTRILSTYTASRAKEGIATGVVWLTDDPTEAENTLKRMRHALAKDAPIGISVDGREGPGSYGLNRNVQLTVLVGKEGKVTANFALVQPSVQTDLPKILEAICSTAGGTPPKLEELQGMAGMMQRGDAATQEVDMWALLVPVIRKDATEEEVIAAAKRLEEAAAKNEAVKREIARITSTIIDAGKLENYGTPKAQEYLKKWKEEYAPRRRGEAGGPDRGAVK